MGHSFQLSIEPSFGGQDKVLSLNDVTTPPEIPVTSHPTMQTEASLLSLPAIGSLPRSQPSSPFSPSLLHHLMGQLNLIKTKYLNRNLDLSAFHTLHQIPQWLGM